jgi:predicted nucleic acid-binding protein
MNKILLDTNVLVYSKGMDSKFYIATQTLLTQNYKFYLTSKNLIEYYSIVTKDVSPITTPQIALEDLKEINDSFTILYPTAESFQVLLKWINLYNPKGTKAHDFEIASIAKAFGIDPIATANLKDFPKKINVLAI